MRIASSRRYSRKTRDWGEWLEIKEELTYAIKTIVEQAGSGFAFPSRSLYIENAPEDRPEIFVPPTAKRGETPKTP